MTACRAKEIERKVFYQHIGSIMKTIIRCKDAKIVFQMGMEMGSLHKSLFDELSKEVMLPREKEETK